MIEDIKKRLEACEVVELECVDRGGFLKDIRRREPNEKILDQAQLLVDHIDCDGDISLVGGIGDIYRNVIVSGEFKYFRIKESLATFDDLIDLAFKALKDGVVKEIGLFDNILMIQESHEAGRVYITINEVNQNGVCKYLGYIDSLYTETFVIESESDTNKLISGDKIVLKNGEVLEFSNNYKGTLWFNFNDYESDTFPFVALKGATVTQKRGR